MKKIYIYPSYDPRHDKTGNTYIRDFHASFGQMEDICVVNRLPGLQTFSMILNLDADVFVIHWVELIPGKPLGFLQCLVFRLVMWLVRMCGKRIVWVLHNKSPHKGRSSTAEKLMAFMARCSDAVVTHSEEGVRFFAGRYPDEDAGKCRYIPHPVYSSDVYPPHPEPKWDYVIWGSVDRRKNVLEFLRFAVSDAELSRKKILVCGQCRDKNHDDEIRSVLADNMTYVSRFLSDDELKYYIGSSRVILFTYNTESVLSSGALIFSLNFMKPVIGPRAGSFADMPGIVSCYDTFEDIPHLRIPENVEEYVVDYMKRNTWSLFAEKFMRCLEE